ncbi:MAG: hypothetical protein LBC20_17780 [Planctomycetaceae bacterium]|nr:hypothetical protein [Planctomycetaceae bacterium]
MTCEKLSGRRCCAETSRRHTRRFALVDGQKWKQHQSPQLFSEKLPTWVNFT